MVDRPHHGFLGHRLDGMMFMKSVTTLRRTLSAQRRRRAFSGSSFISRIVYDTGTCAGRGDVRGGRRRRGRHRLADLGWNSRAAASAGWQDGSGYSFSEAIPRCCWGSSLFVLAECPQDALTFPRQRAFVIDSPSARCSATDRSIDSRVRERSCVCFCSFIPAERRQPATSFGCRRSSRFSPAKATRRGLHQRASVLRPASPC